MKNTLSIVLEEIAKKHPEYAEILNLASGVVNEYTTLIMNSNNKFGSAKGSVLNARALIREVDKYEKASNTRFPPGQHDRYYTRDKPETITA